MGERPNRNMGGLIVIGSHSIRPSTSGVAGGSDCLGLDALMDRLFDSFKKKMGETTVLIAAVCAMIDKRAIYSLFLVTSKEEMVANKS